MKSHKIRWGTISLELSRHIPNIFDLKNGKQCKERWFNHLSPHVNKYEFSNSFKITQFLKRKCWNLCEDIELLRESLSNPGKWVKIAKDLPGRTEHSVKNRFISIMSQDVGCSSKKIRSFIMNKSILQYIHQTLSKLTQEYLKEVEIFKVKEFNVDDFLNLNGGEMYEKKLTYSLEI